MASTKLKDLEIGDKKVSVFVDDEGKFIAKEPESGRELATAKNLSDLKKKVRDQGGITGKALRLLSYDWDAEIQHEGTDGRRWSTELDGPDEPPDPEEADAEPEEIVICGIHGGNGNLLKKSRYGGSEQVSSYGTDNYFLPEDLGAADLKELRELKVMLWQVRRAMKKWHRDRRLGANGQEARKRLETLLAAAPKAKAKDKE